MGVRVGVYGDVDGEVMEGSLGGKTTVDRRAARNISVCTKLIRCTIMTKCYHCFAAANQNPQLSYTLLYDLVVYTSLLYGAQFLSLYPLCHAVHSCLERVPVHRAGLIYP